MLICGSLWWDCNYYFRISSRERLLDVLFRMNFRVSNSMKIRRFRWNRNNRNKFIGINNVFTLKFYNGNWLLDVVTATLGIKNDICLSSRQILLFFCKRRRCLCIYIYILMLLLVIGTSRNTKNHIDYHRKM